MNERRLPPVTQIGMTSLALIVAGGIYLAAHLPNHVPLAPAIALLTVSVLLLAGNLASLARVPDFPWSRFFEVAKWALLAYVIIAGMIEYSFLRDHITAECWSCSRSRWSCSPCTCPSDRLHRRPLHTSLSELATSAGPSLRENPPAEFAQARSVRNAAQKPISTG